jgi:light-independent protochlorophyllide reductase subunit B
MFKEDFEFHEQAGASHLPASSKPPASDPISFDSPLWTQDAEQALKKIPFFVRKKARANTERFARDRNLSSITLDVLYEAKAHYAR